MAILSRLPFIWRARSASTSKDGTSAPNPVAKDTPTALNAHGINFNTAPARVLNGATPRKPLDIPPATPAVKAPEPTPKAENGQATSTSSATPATSAPDGSAKPQPTYVPPDFAIDEWRRMKVVVIGAGYSGITAGIRCVTSLPASLAWYSRTHWLFVEGSLSVYRISILRSTRKRPV